VRVQLRKLLYWPDFIPDCLVKIVNIGHISALAIMHLATKQYHSGFVNYSRMSFEFSRIVRYLFIQLLPFEPVELILQLYSIEI
jgi:hypothetical protein